MPNSGFGDMLELVIGTSHQRFRWQVVPAGSLARPVGAHYEDAPSLSRCERTEWLEAGQDMTELEIHAVDGESIVSLPGTNYAANTPARSRQFLAKCFSMKDNPRAAMIVSEFLIRAWRLANNRARELGWIG